MCLFEGEKQFQDFTLIFKALLEYEENLTWQKPWQNHFAKYLLIFVCTCKQGCAGGGRGEHRIVPIFSNLQES